MSARYRIDSRLPLCLRVSVVNAVRFAVSRAFTLSQSLPATFPRLLAMATARNPSADGGGLFSEAGTGSGYGEIRFDATSIKIE